MADAKPFTAIQAEYEYRKNIQEITVHEHVRVGWFGHVDVKCDVESAEQQGRNKGWLEAVETIFGVLK